MRIALVSNVTTATLAGLLGESGCSIWQPTGFGAWRETALMPPADLLAFDPEVIALLIDRRFVPAETVAAADVASARDALARQFPSASVIVPDLAALAAEYGDGFYDERMWKLARLPWSLRAQRAIVQLLTPVKKVIALDLDGTLWDGVIAEDGPDGIRPKKDFLIELKALKNRGILLTAISKNDADLAAAGLSVCAEATHGLISRDDFVAVVCGYGEKAGCIRQLADSLNLAADSFVFVDDNPAERAAMRALMPEVLTSVFPPQFDALFPPQKTTAEDALRTGFYQSEAKRKELERSVGTVATGTKAYEDYLASLKIETVIHEMTADEIPRVAQLSQKTNQFNVRTNRYSESEISRMAERRDRIFYTMRASDRFGDLGLVAFIQVSVGGDRAEIIDWVMSCRAMNRRMEFTFEAAVEKALDDRGIRQLAASWRRTPRNAPVADLFDRFGFDVALVAEDEKRYTRFLTRQTFGSTNGS